MFITRENMGMKITAIILTVLMGVCTGGADVLAQVGPEAVSGGTQVATQAAPAPIKQPLPEEGNVTVNFKDVDIQTVLMYLSEVSGVDIIPSPGVDASVTMRLRNKPWEVALDIVTRNYGYVYSRDDEQGIIRVMPKSQLQSEEPITEVISLQHIIREIQLMKGDEGDDVEVQERLESIQQLMIAVNSIIDPVRGERATFISSANAIVVTAIPARISEVKNMINTIDKKPPQVVLDCKVIEIGLNDTQQFGIDWNAVITAAGARQPITFPFTNAGLLTNLAGDVQRMFQPKYGVEGTDEASRFPYLGPQTMNPTVAPQDNAIFAYGTLDFSQFTATLRAISQMQDAEILSSPRITTLNNQKATIKVVEKIMLQKTQETTQTAGIVTVEFEDEAEAREAGIILVVIPHINEEGDISVNLLPEVSVNDGFQSVPVAGFQTAVSLNFRSREANTIVRVKDGETIFLGGLIRENVVTQENKVPILGDLFGSVPVVGNALKYDSEEVERTEVVFFITVHLLEESLESVEVSNTEKHFNKYVSKTFKDREEERIQAKEEEKAKNDPFKLFTGFFKEKKEEKEVVLPPTEAVVEEKKETKPFLDFRKKED